VAPNPVVPGDYLDSLKAASAVATDDIWAVGVRQVSESSAATVALFEHWDGREWTVVQGADLGGRSARLNAVAAITSNDVWAVGLEESPLETLAEHWDGRRWSVVPTPPIGKGQGPTSWRSLDSISALSTTDIWALGHFDLNDLAVATTTQDVFEHWNGRAWTIVLSPQDRTGTGISAMQSVSAASSNDVWAVGGRVNGFGEVGRVDAPIVERWNGRVFAKVSAPTSERPLTKVAAISSDDVWAVRGGDFNLAGGGYGFGPVQILHWDGRSWTISFRPSGSDSVITSITAVAHNDIWAVGTRGGVPLIEIWDGKRWTVPADADGRIPAMSQYAWPPSVTHTAKGDVVVFSAEPDPRAPQNRLWFRCGGSSS